MIYPIIHIELAWQYIAMIRITNLEEPMYYFNFLNIYYLVQNLYYKYIISSKVFFFHFWSDW